MADAWEDKSIKNAWDDEEEDDDNVKDDWDAPDPEPVKPAPKPVTKITTKVGKPAKVKKAFEDMTEEEKKQAQLDADFEHAKELLGLEESLDEISFESKDDYRNYIQRLMLKLNLFSANKYYFDFMDELLKAMTEKLTGDQCRKLSNSLRVIQDQKIAEEKKNNPKETGKKGKKGAKIKLEKNAIGADFDMFLKDSHGGVVDDDDDGDDFM